MELFEINESTHIFKLAIDEADMIDVPAPASKCVSISVEAVIKFLMIFI